MEKLKLKHIVGYLPYRFKSTLNTGKIITVSGLRSNERSGICLISDGEYWQDVFEVKPLLRPLSDLTKEIEFNGEKFVPMDKLAEIEEIVCLIYALEFFETSSAYLPFWIIQKLYEWHFDIHGLIEKGLAIDLNTINNGIQ